MKENGTYQDGLESNNLPESLRKNPFGVPENYFSDLELKIIAQVKLGERNDESVFAVPEGYFDSLPDFIIGKIAADSLKVQLATDGFALPKDYSTRLTENILNQISAEKLKAEIQSDGFILPADYELTLEQAILTRITEQKLKEFVPRDGFEFPSNYDSTLQESILVRVAEQKLKQTIPSEGFSAPQHYFENLSDSIVRKIPQSGLEEQKNTPVHRIGKSKKWYARYAVAASFVAMLSIGGYWGYQSQQQNTVLVNNVDRNAEEQLSQHLSEIPKQEIINYLAASGSGDDIIYMVQYTDEANLPTQGFGNNVSKQEIEDYLNYTL